MENCILSSQGHMSLSKNDEMSGRLLRGDFRPCALRFKGGTIIVAGSFTLSLKTGELLR